MRVVGNSRHLSPPTKAAGACFKNRRVTEPGTWEGTLAIYYRTAIIFAADPAGPGLLNLRDHVND